MNIVSVEDREDKTLKACNCTVLKLFRNCNHFVGMCYTLELHNIFSEGSIVLLIFFSIPKILKSCFKSNEFEQRVSFYI